VAEKNYCQIVVGTVRGTRDRFPLSQSGWAAAKREAHRAAAGRDKWLALVDLECPGGRIAMYQCSENERGNVHCGIESVADPDHATPPIAGRRRAKRRRK